MGLQSEKSLGYCNGEKSKYLDNLSVLPTSIIIFFDKFVDGTQLEVASEIAGRWHILRFLYCVILSNIKGGQINFSVIRS